MKYTAKHWGITIHLIDILIVALIIFSGWLAWYLFRLGRKAELPFVLLMLFGMRALLVFRNAAKKEKKKAEEVESNILDVTEVSK
jgi:hypothetical protein